MSLLRNGTVHVSAKTDYALRAMVELAAVGPGGSMAAHAIADRQGIPLSFLLNILADLRRSGMIESRAGAHGGWWLEPPAEEITVADVIRAVDGPLVGPTASRHRPTTDREINQVLDELWRAVGVGIVDILEHTTIASLLPAGWREHHQNAATQFAC
jgi:Rrf2 family protein